MHDTHANSTLQPTIEHLNTQSVHSGQYLVGPVHRTEKMHT